MEVETDSDEMNSIESGDSFPVENSQQSEFSSIPAENAEANEEEEEEEENRSSSSSSSPSTSTGPSAEDPVNEEETPERPPAEEDTNKTEQQQPLPAEQEETKEDGVQQVDNRPVDDEPSTSGTQKCTDPTEKLSEGSIGLALATLRARLSGTRFGGQKSNSSSPAPVAGPSSGGIQAELLMGGTEATPEAGRQSLGYVRPLRPLLPKPPDLTKSADDDLADLHKVRATTVQLPAFDALDTEETQEGSANYAGAESRAGSSRRKTPQLGSKPRQNRTQPPIEAAVNLVDSGITDRPRMSAGITKIPAASPDIEILEESGGLSDAYLAKCLKLSDDDVLERLCTRPDSPPVYIFEKPPPDVLASLATSKVFDPNGHPCEDCGDVYALRSSLEFHLERRCQNIAAFCKFCNKTTHFLNGCRFLQHARLHKLPPKGCYDRIKTFPLRSSDIEKAFDQWYSCPAFNRLTDLATCYAYEFGQEPLKVDADDSSAKPNPSGTWCTECSGFLASDEELRQHFAYNLPSNQRQLICKSTGCSAVYFSHCSLKAHSRTHEQIDKHPFSCAECGQKQSSSAALMEHLTGHQSAPTVLNAWRCLKCSMFYSNWNTVLVHTAVAHCNYFFKCPACVQAFQNTNACAEHVKKEHPMFKYNADLSGHVQKCVQCEQMFRSREELLEHLKVHLNSLMPFKIFRCPMCGRLLENKVGLVTHYHRSHQIQLKPSDVEEKVIVGTEPTEHKQSRKRPHSGDKTDFKCPKCPKELSSDFLLRLHMKMEHGENLKPEELRSAHLSR